MEEMAALLSVIFPNGPFIPQNSLHPRNGPQGKAMSFFT